MLAQVHQVGVMLEPLPVRVAAAHRSFDRGQGGVHRYNYCDLPVIDMIFGTFRNPETFESKCGYWDGASSKVGEMLIGRDVTKAA